MYDYLFRFILLGDSYCGKTAFTQKITRGLYTNQYEPTIGVDYATKSIIVNNNSYIKCQIWDTAGQTRYAPLLTNYYRDIAGVIIMFDVTRRKTFTNLNFWIKQLKENGPDNVSVILVGNKSDLENKRYVTKQEAELFAKNNNFFYTETSVKKNDVSNILYILCDDILKDVDNRTTGIVLNKKEIITNINQKTEKEKNTCCIIL